MPSRRRIADDNVLAQQKQQLSFKTSAENTKYTQQHLIDVGDVPGHQVRVYELHCTFPNNAPVMNGVAIKEQWTRAISDYTDNNGPGTTYGVYVLENGDKFFTRSVLVAQSTGRVNFRPLQLDRSQVAGKVRWDSGNRANSKYSRSESGRK